MDKSKILPGIIKRRKNFIFYDSFKEAIDSLEPKYRLALYDAITTYSLYHIEPKLDGIPNTLWLLIKPQLDSNWQRFQKGCLGAEYGKLGGRPTKTPRLETHILPNEKENEKVNIKDNQNNKDWKQPQTL